MFGGHLIQRDILFRKSGGLFFLNAVQKSLYAAVASVQTVIQMREDRQMAAVSFEWPKSGGSLIVPACGGGKEVAWIKPQMVADAHQSTWSTF